MSQSDFATLVVQNELAEKNPEPESSEEEVNVVSKVKQSVDLPRAKSEDNPSMVDVSANCFPDVMHDFVAAWEASDNASTNSLDINAALVSEEMFEPTRRLTDFAPPKLFYRTFWRSASRRILAMSSKQTK